MSGNDKWAVRANAALEVLPGRHEATDGPVFEKPWHARLFAIGVALEANGLFAWDSWPTRLGKQLRQMESAVQSVNDTYFESWFEVLAGLIEDERIADLRPLIDRYAQAWTRAADRTPHGEPIVLCPVDFRKEE